MKNICLHFQVHQPYRLRPFSFMHIGEDNQYFDETANRHALARVARNAYLPANRILLDLIRQYGERFRVSFSVSGLALDQFQEYMPEVTASFRALADTGCVEFLALPYGHSLAGLKSRREVARQLSAHADAIAHLFGQKPGAFSNTDLAPANVIAEAAAGLGFRTMLAGALPGLNAGRAYSAPGLPGMRMLLQHGSLSGDIANRFSDEQWQEWPLTADKFREWLQAMPQEDEVVNLSFDYTAFGERHPAASGIFEFLQALPAEMLAIPGWRFATVSEAAAAAKPLPAAVIPAEGLLQEWLGNDLQQDAFESLYALEKKVHACDDPQLQRDWLYLQASDHFYYMSTRHLGDGTPHRQLSPYDHPFHAFMNYMNVLADFTLRIAQCPNHQKTQAHERYTIEA